MKIDSIYTTTTIVRTIESILVMVLKVQKISENLLVNKCDNVNKSRNVLHLN